MSNTITELKFDSDFPLSKKMEELSELSKKIDSQKTYTLFSHEQEAILTIPKNRNKIKKLIDKKIEKFLNKNMIGFEGNKEDTMNEVLKIYERTIQSYHKTIDKLKSKQYNESNNIILKKLKTYKPKKDEKVILFSPALDQPVECEYDINMLISFNIFSEKDKIEYATLMFDYNYLISSEYLKLVKYIEDNIKIEEYSDLVQLKKEIKNKKIIFTGKFSKILEKNKVVIDIDNHYNIYKEEIMLAMLTADKLDKTKNSFIKNYFRKNKYNGGYEYMKWFILETYYNNYEYNDKDFIKPDLLKLLTENTNIGAVVIKKKDIIIKEDYRKDIDLIRHLFAIYLETLGLKKYQEYSYISTFDYPEEGGKNHTFIKVELNYIRNNNNFIIVK